ncbi:MULTISPECIES: hypothetical protein [Sphingomonas]|jgi:hypothetical protein|uniref:UrcA family protein n=1 Tax=Sphingomonas turrisvirgatae TaxID=1888892 RepID=A0A1E3LY50_9SPHN|nr:MULTISPECIES: hypothetical protein [Sphingomonas]MDK8187375.1 hypothetical protein [Sphingomonas zeae]MDK8217180.1 hypothetical protein [Sphingomonas sp. UMB7805-LC452B]ODP38015.1 hypothetical protein BFL28_16030 [Sphingomonas turrisvirgatae]
MKLAIGAVLAACVATPGQAQVFDMGGLTGTLSQDGVTQSEERRASGRSARAAQMQRSARYDDERTICTKSLPMARADLGPRNAKVAQLAAACRRAGY